MLDFELEAAVLRGERFEHLDAGCDDFWTNSVGWDGSNFMDAHDIS